MDMPTAEDYMRAVQNPRLVFHQPSLRDAVFDTHPLLGIPIPASGTSAIVFKATVDGESQALRFLTRPDAATRLRYTALNAHFTERGLTRDVATSQWIDDAITVNGRTWPMVRMQWVAGKTLNQHVEDLLDAGDTASVATLATAWRDLLRRTQTTGFAHGDLQHGNVMVEPDGTPRLVDFDCSWIEAFAGSAPPAESGHRNYQRPARPWGRWMDTFPGLVIYLSLLAVARDREAWQLHNGENLLFSDADFVPPHQTDTWWRIARLSDPRLDAMAAALRACCAPSWAATSDLETLLSAPVPWWLRTGAAGQAPVASSAPPAPLPPPRQARGVWWGPPVTAPPQVRVPRRRTVALITFLVWLAAAMAIAAVADALDAREVIEGAGLLGLLPAGAAAMFLARRRRKRLGRTP